MHKIQTLNNISIVGLERFERGQYEVASELTNPHAIMVRSAAAGPGRLAFAVGLYLAGYLVWGVIGAIALRRWQLVLLFPFLLFMDWMQRAVTIHGFVKAIKEPTAECRWTSPPRFATAGGPS